jgi:DNA-binding MarR family transcriptional regulator
MRLATLSSRGAATAQAIVDSTRTHKSSISRAVASLTGRGLIAREGSSSDGRRVVLRLSTEGEALMRELTPLVLQGEREIFSRLTGGEHLQLLAAVAAVEAALDLDAEDGPP